MSIFTRHGADTSLGRIAHATATLPSGALLQATAYNELRGVHLGLITGMGQAYAMAFTACEARAVAAELVACADALDQQGRA